MLFSSLELIFPGAPLHEVWDFISLVLFPVPPGRLEANQTFEGAGGSITSVDFDPSVRGLCRSVMHPSPQVSAPGTWGLWDLREHPGCPRTGPFRPA